LAIHLAIMHHAIHSTSTNYDLALQALLAIESQLLNGSLVASHAEGYTGEYTQRLHELSRQMVILDHYNDRNTATVTKLIKETSRIQEETEKLRDSHHIDAEPLERLRDGLLCLEDFCIDRARRLQNRKQRVQNLIALVFTPRDWREEDLD